MVSGLFSGGVARQMAQANLSQSTAQQASRVAAEARSQSDVLRADVEKLFMVTEALWTILKEERGYSDDELIRRIQQIDLRDGRLDGKVAKQLNPACPQCGRTLLGKHPVCLYCGTEVERDPFER